MYYPFVRKALFSSILSAPAKLFNNYAVTGTPLEMLVRQKVPAASSPAWANLKTRWVWRPGKNGELTRWARWGLVRLRSAP